MLSRILLIVIPTGPAVSPIVFLMPERMSADWAVARLPVVVVKCAQAVRLLCLERENLLVRLYGMS